MKIVVNKKELDLAEAFPLADLLQQMGCTKMAAIWINNQQLLTAEYSRRILHDGDQVVIIKIMGGG